MAKGIRPVRGLSSALLAAAFVLTSTASCGRLAPSADETLPGGASSGGTNTSLSAIPQPAAALCDQPRTTPIVPETYGGPPLELPAAVRDLRFLNWYSLNEAQLAFLAEHGFVVVPADWPEFYDVYTDSQDRGLPVYVTLDSLLHVYHLLFDRVLREIEDEILMPELGRLITALADSAADLHDEAQATELEEEARRAWAYFEIARQLIETEAGEPPQAIADLVRSELDNISGEVGMAVSPLLSHPGNELYEASESWQDYTQYRPRGHYTRSEARARYYRTMAWLGRATFKLSEPRETRTALLIVKLVEEAKVDGEPALGVWRRIYEPTAFLVGLSDDLGVDEYAAAARTVYGSTPTLADLAEAEQLTAFMESPDLPDPRINPTLQDVRTGEDIEQRGFRLMGQRFTLDAYVFDRLTWPNVGTQRDPRYLAAGLDAFAALGSDEALQLQRAAGAAKYANYEAGLAALRREIGGLTDADWQQNIYWQWLDVLRTFGEDKGEQYPTYMQGEPWALKDLHTALGSWTELKHDTLLYAKPDESKQGYAGPEGIPLNYVEPNVTALARLLDLVRLTVVRLAERDLIRPDDSTPIDPTDADAGQVLRLLADDVEQLLRLAERQLAGEPVDLAVNEELQWFGSKLERYVALSADVVENPDLAARGGRAEVLYLEEEPAALVADVATGGGHEAGGFEVLEEAIGPVYELYVITPSASSGWQVARGGVFSWFEFVVSDSERLTDEDWRRMVEEGKLPDQPEWTSEFIIP